MFLLYELVKCTSTSIPIIVVFTYNKIYSINEINDIKNSPLVQVTSQDNRVPKGTATTDLEIKAKAYDFPAIAQISIITLYIILNTQYLLQYQVHRNTFSFVSGWAAKLSTRL